MKNTISIPDNEKKVAVAFGFQSKEFDDRYGDDPIIEYKRKRVRDHVKRFLFPGSKVLELNCGTGEDALWMAGQGCRVHATDISSGMLEILSGKVASEGAADLVSYELCSFSKLTHLVDRGPYNLIFSNFAGLNCTGELSQVLSSLAALLQPGGILTLVVLPPFCLWEFLLLFKGKFRTATRRFFSKGGRRAQIAGHEFACWYYSPSYITRHLKKDFRRLGMEGLCTLVPPSYIEDFAPHYPNAWKFLKKWEDRLKDKWLWRSVGDYYIISFRKK